MERIEDFRRMAWSAAAARPGMTQARGQARGMEGGEPTSRPPADAMADALGVPAVAALKAEIEDLKTQLGQAAPQRAVAELDQAFTLLHRRVESLRGAGGGVAPEAVAALATEIVDLRAALDAVRAPERFQALAAGVEVLSRRIDILIARAVDPVEVARLQAQTTELKGLVTRALSGTGLQSVAERLAAVTERVAAIGSEAAARVEAASSAFKRDADALVARVDAYEASARADRGAAVDVLRRDLDTNVRGIHDRLDHVTDHLMALSPAIGSELAGHLGSVVERIEAARSRDMATIDALAEVVERHLTALTGRVRSGEKRLERLDGIEESLDTLCAEMREVRHAAAQSGREQIEAAIGAAIEDAADAVSRKVAATADGPAVLGLKRGLATLEARQNEVERRTCELLGDAVAWKLEERTVVLDRAGDNFWASSSPTESSPAESHSDMPGAPDERFDPHVAAESRAAGPKSAARNRARRSSPGAAGETATHRKKRGFGGRWPFAVKLTPAIIAASGLLALATVSAAVAWTHRDAISTGFFQDLSPERKTAEGSGAPARSAADLPALTGSQALRHAALDGDLAAAYEMGVRFADGVGVEQDLDTGIKWLGYAVSRGSVPAAYRLASLYENNRQDVGEAYRFYKWAAEQGHVRAMHHLAVLYSQGIEGAPDWNSAIAWFRRAAGLGLRDSAHNLGVIFARGLAGTRNTTEALTWFEIAARAGDRDSAEKREVLAKTASAETRAKAKAAADAFVAQPADEAANMVATRPEWRANDTGVDTSADAVPLSGRVLASVR